MGSVFAKPGVPALLLPPARAVSTETARTTNLVVIPLGELLIPYRFTAATSMIRGLGNTRYKQVLRSL